MSGKVGFIILLMLPLFGFGQVTEFMGRYRVNQVEYVDDTTWKLTGTFHDLTGSYTGLSCAIGDKIVQRDYDALGRMVYDKYKVVSIVSKTVTNIVVNVRSDYDTLLTSNLMPITGDFPIARSVNDTSVLTYRTSFYLNQIDLDYDAALDNLNLQEVNVQINEPEADPIYAADSAAIKDTLTSHNTRINQRVRSITATSPVISSGGYTPNISIDTTILITRYDTANFATITEVNTRDTLVKKYTRDRFRTMSNHDSLSRLDERSYESLTSKPVLTVTQDLPYSSVITLDSSDVILTTEQYNTLRQIGNEILIGTDTSNIITRYDTAVFATYTETVVRDTLVKQYARGRFRTMSNHDSLSMLDEKSYNSLTDKPTTWAWNNITGVPATYTPTAHTQAISTIIGLQDTLDRHTDTLQSHNSRLIGKQPMITADVASKFYAWDKTFKTIDYSYLSGTPSSMTPSTHTHTIAQSVGLQDSLDRHTDTLQAHNSRINDLVNRVDTVLLSKDTSFTDLIQSGWLLRDIIFQNHTINTAQISAGTRLSMSNLFASEAVAKNKITTIKIEKTFSESTSIYFSDVGLGDAWNGMIATAYVLSEKAIRGVRWMLRSGDWDDYGIWKDTEVWID